jgi:hypothetical protein
MNTSIIFSSFTSLAVTDLQKAIDDFCVTAVIGAGICLVVLVIASAFINKRWPKSKMFLFVLIAVVSMGTTLTIGGSTVYLNAVSATGGPVRWSADIEFWACGNQLEIRDPRGLLNNRIGTSTMYEQNDGKIHYTGTPIDLPQDASLSKFMSSIGGSMNANSFTLPLNDENYFEDTVDGDGLTSTQPGMIANNISTKKDGTYATFTSGQNCGSEPSEVQIYTFRFNKNNDTYTQTKISTPQDYEISHYNQSPPGDCIIVEFGPKQDKTDKLCNSYGTKDKNRCGLFGVRATKRDTCTIWEEF